MQVLRAGMLIEEGKNFQEVIEDVEKLKEKIVTSLSFDSLDNLVRGGRLPKAVGVVTGILGIKLILDMKNGVMAVKDKVRGSKKAMKRILMDLDNNELNSELPVLIVNLDMDEITGPLKKYFDERKIGRAHV